MTAELSTARPDDLPQEPIAPPLYSGWKYMPTKKKFDAEKHLNIGAPRWKKYLSDLGYENGEDISNFAAAEPFPMFTKEAVRLMRNDILSEPVQENHVSSTPRSPYMIRGFAHKHSPFIYDALTHPKVLKAISDVVGMGLVPAHDFEVGHVNVQLGPKGRDGVRDLSDIPTLPLPEGQRVAPSEYDSRMVDDWHFDQVPYVAVLMLSDTTGMIGGETAVMTKDGTADVVPGPVLGSVAVLQGSKVRHAALRAANCSERIAMVLSLRPADVFAEDTTSLATSIKHDDVVSLGMSWLDYRLKVLENRCKLKREELLRKGNFTKEDLIDFCNSQMRYFHNTASEIFPNNPELS